MVEWGVVASSRVVLTNAWEADTIVLGWWLEGICLAQRLLVS